MNDLNCSKFKDRKCTQQIFYYNFSIIIELSSCYDFWYKKKNQVRFVGIEIT